MIDPLLILKIFSQIFEVQRKSFQLYENTPELLIQSFLQDFRIKKSVWDRALAQFFPRFMWSHLTRTKTETETTNSGIVKTLGTGKRPTPDQDWGGVSNNI